MLPYFVVSCNPMTLQVSSLLPVAASDQVSHGTSPRTDRDVSVAPQTRLRLVSPESHPGRRCRWKLANNCSTVHVVHQLDNDDASGFSAAYDEFYDPLKSTYVVKRQSHHVQTRTCTNQDMSRIIVDCSRPVTWRLYERHVVACDLQLYVY